MSAAFDDFGVAPGTGERRVLCPQCGDRNRKKTCGVDTDEGVFHCFRCGFKGRVNQGNWLQAEVDRLKRRPNERHDRTADAAAKLWCSADACHWHPYLKRKAVQPLGIRQRGSLLVIPLYDAAGKLWNCQTIDHEGQKLFLKGGRVTSCYYPIKGASEEIYITEGFATGATIHTYIRPDSRVAVAFNAGNLKPVALALRQKYPGVKLIVAADDDQWTDGNPGMTQARAAAEAVRGQLLHPNWGDLDLSSQPTDFNDLWQLRRSV